MTDPTTRFGDRVRDYVLYRPRYPKELVAALERAGMSRDAPVADLGAGTGISARLLLEAGYEVFAVEPNAPMRAAAEAELSSFATFHSVDGTAESTTLADASVGAVIAAQAFHWFDPPRTLVEMGRILRAPRFVALVWNERRMGTPFLDAYEHALLEHGIDYGAVRHQDAASPEKIAQFFGATPFSEIVLPNAQRFDRQGLFGRALSSSYVPAKGHPKHEAMMAALGLVFERHHSDGLVTFEYDTRAYVALLG
jgi:SAM-dependent methyltransferase